MFEYTQGRIKHWGRVGDQRVCFKVHRVNGDHVSRNKRNIQNKGEKSQIYTFKQIQSLQCIHGWRGEVIDATFRMTRIAADQVD